MQSNNVKNGFLNDNVKIYVTKEFNEKYKSNQLKSGDMLMVQSGHAGATAVVSDAYEGSNCHALIIMKPKSNINTVFLNNYFQSGKGVKSIYSLITGNTIKHILSSDVKKITFSTPVIGEQEKIGDFFSKLDRQIELEEQKLAKLEEQKKGYMQKIFSQELRFKDENWEDYPEWEIKKLDELGEFNSGVGFPEKYQGGNTGIPFFKVSDMNLLGNEKFMNTANNYVSIEQIKQKKWKVIQNVPAIIFAKVGAAIMLNRKRMILNPFLIDNNTMSYSFSNHWDTNFGHVVFQTLNLPKYAQVGALPSYNSKDIGIIQIRLPIKEEQEKIGDFFSKLDELINKQNQKIDGLKKRKQGFLQKMFV